MRHWNEKTDGNLADRIDELQNEIDHLKAGWKLEEKDKK